MKNAQSKESTGQFLHLHNSTIIYFKLVSSSSIVPFALKLELAISTLFSVGKILKKPSFLIIEISIFIPFLNVA
jgi:hypothetical protein